MASQMKFIIALALIGAIVCSVSAQDYDDEGSSQGDGYGGFSGSGGGDDDYAAPRERGALGAEGSDNNPGYHAHGGEDAGNENYDAEDSAAAASEPRPVMSRANLVKLIRQSRK